MACGVRSRFSSGGGQAAGGGAAVGSWELAEGDGGFEAVETLTSGQAERGAVAGVVGCELADDGAVPGVEEDLGEGREP